MLEETANRTGKSEREIFDEASMSEFAPPFAFNVDMAWQYYLDTGFVPYFVNNYIREVLDGEEQTS